MAFSAPGYASNLVSVVAGRVVEGEAIDPVSLVDLTASVRDGVLTWSAPAGLWRVMKFTWRFNGTRGGQQKYVSVDGADEACTDWFIRTVYQPHYDRFKADFGKTIGRTQDWKKAYVSLLAGQAIDLEAKPKA